LSFRSGGIDWGRRFHRVSAFSLALLASGPLAAPAEERSSGEARPAEGPSPEGASEEVPEEEPPIEIERVDTAHAAVSRHVAEIADRVDGFFVDERVDEGFNRTRIRLRGGPRIRARDGVDPDLSFQLNLSLPRTRRRVGFFASGGLNEDQTLDAAEFPGEREADDVGVGLRVFVLDRAEAQLNVDGGFRFVPQPDPFTRIRAVRPLLLGEFVLRPTQFLFWGLDEGFGEETRIDLDRALTRNLFGRLRGELEWSESSNGVEPTGRTFLFQRIDKRSALRHQFRIKGETHPSAIVTSYLLSVRYRRLLYKNWFYGEVEPLAEFKNKHDWEFSPGVVLRAEVQFGKGLIRDWQDGPREALDPEEDS
jgi:hypothetical protein